jgi:tRNA pseudouridine55 synthase
MGHTGTLDPRATGLLALVAGRATRIAALLTAGDKTYDASIRLGVTTDTDDADGRPLGGSASVMPTDADVDAALARFRGTFAQRPPSHSAKKIAGKRAYEIARRNESVALAPVTVTVSSLERRGRDGDVVNITVAATSGFYVRALARDLGEALGCGAHLASLRRTRSGQFDVADAVPLAEAERLGADLAGRLIAPADALPHLAAVRTTARGLVRATHGNPLGPDDLEGRCVPPAASPGPVRILAGDGRLVALAHARGGSLHPVIVLG